MEGKAAMDVGRRRERRESGIGGGERKKFYKRRGGKKNAKARLTEKIVKRNLLRCREEG